MLSDFNAFGLTPIELQPGELLAELVPPREFSSATFETYIPDLAHPSQAMAREACRRLAKDLAKGKRANLPGVYLDGGFGVGKTHLLVSLYRDFKGSKLFGSFLAITSAVGALGFANAVDLFGKYNLICIDEFELDDPGNTMIMSRLIGELNKNGTVFAVTSNTPPNALGDGRFAAADFRREILGLGEKFEVVRIDGEDYRHRSFDTKHRVFTEVELDHWLRETPDDGAHISFSALLKLLSGLHPAKYAKLLANVSRLAITDAFEISDEFDALRFVAFVDRAYEAQVLLRATGMALPEVFIADMLNGGYRKKYLRAISRLGILAA